MPTSERVKNGSKTRGSKSTPVGAESISGNEFDEQRQGINLRDSFDQTTALFTKIRPNSDEVITLNGIDTSENVFDESISTVNFVDASDRISNVNIGSIGRISSRMSHLMELRDLGQTHLYDDGLPYFDNQDINPVHVIETNPLTIELPPMLADHNSMSALDGVIDIFNTREKINRESIEAPFFAKGVRGSIGAVEDSYRRSAEIFTGLSKEGDVTESYLDSQETMGAIVDSKFKGIMLPGFHSEEVAKVSPFVDEASERSSFYSNSSVDGQMRSVLVLSRSLGVNYDLNKPIKISGPIPAMFEGFNLSSNLQLWTRFNSGLARDFSVNSRNLTLVNSPVSRLNQNIGGTHSYDAMEFNGANSGGNGVNIGAAGLWDAIIGNDTAGGSTQQMTFSFWINKTGHGGNDFGRLIDFGDRDIEIYTNLNNTLFLGVKWNGGTNANHRVSWNAPTGALSLNEWIHIAVTYDAVNTASSAFFYINGVEYVDNTPDPSDDSAPNNGVTGPFFGIDGLGCIIGNNINLTRTFEGMIAEVGIWNRVLAHKEILALYRASKFGTIGESPNMSNLNNYQIHDKMALTGYRYENNSIGVDSIAFGGLLK